MDNHPRNWPRDLRVTDPVFINYQSSFCLHRFSLRDVDDDSLCPYHSSIRDLPQDPGCHSGCVLLLMEDNPIIYPVSINISDQMETGLGRHRVPKVAQVGENVTKVKKWNKYKIKKDKDKD